MAQLLLTGGKPRSLPPKKSPSREVARLFYLRRKELSEKANSLPGALSKDVDSLYSNARQMRRMLREQGIRTRSPEDVLEYFGVLFAKDEESRTTASNSEEAAKALGREALGSASAPEDLKRSASRQLKKIQSHETLDAARTTVYGLFLADLVAGHNFTLANAIKFRAQTEFSGKCTELDSLPHQARLPRFWSMALWAAASAVGMGAAAFIDNFKAGVPLREALTHGAAVFGLFLGGGILIAAKFFHTDRKLLRERLGIVFRNLEALEKAYNEAAGLVGSMEELQKNLLQAIGELGKRSGNTSQPGD